MAATVTAEERKIATEQLEVVRAKLRATGAPCSRPRQSGPGCERKCWS